MAKLVNKPTIGELLVKNQAISADELEHGLELQQKYGGLIGEILTHNGALKNKRFYELLAEQLNLDFVDLSKIAVDNFCLDFANIELYLRWQFVVLTDERQTLIVTPQPQNITAELLQLLNIADYQLAITAPYDLFFAINRHFKLNLTKQASHKLAEQTPHLAINPDKRLLKNWQIFAVIIPIIISAYFYGTELITTSLTLLLCFFSLMLIFKAGLFLIGGLVRHKVHHIGNIAQEITDTELPIYSVLIPLFHEEKAASDIIKAIQSLDYPAHKIDAKLIVEEGDIATLQAIKNAAPDARFHIVVVPQGKPQTKARACNYALPFVRGEYVVIYDAEDLPACDQLKRAAYIFAHYPEIACLQARLNYYNYNENMLTSLFSLEYAILFDWLLPALYWLKIPIPLGGTSNHLRRNILQQIGGWDAFNVTEDADLGLRLAAYGYQTLPILSLTLEEAPLRFEAWIKQRTRWVKGYLQSWHVFCKGRTHQINSKATAKNTQTGKSNQPSWNMLQIAGAHVFIGLASINYVVAIIAWGLVVAAFYNPTLWKSSMSDNYFAILLFFSLFLHWLMAYIAQTKSAPYFKKTNKINVLIYPFYFSLHSLAGIRAVYQLFKNPYHWEKTTHSLTRFKRF
jgi:glycosyltransferase XagB